MDLYIGKVVQGGNGVARYRIIFRDSDGVYILRSIGRPHLTRTVTTLELMTKWRVIS